MLEPSTPPAAARTSVHAARELGQSIWLDYIDRELIGSGELARLIREDGLSGITTNPAIFAKAITEGDMYSGALAALRARGASPLAQYEGVAIEDVRAAADLFRPLYLATERGDGYVSLEVSPYLARNAEATIAEARRLWAAVDRDNVMIKVPATDAGVVALEQLIADQINVNVTLIFSFETYDRVARAYLAGLERLAARGGAPGRVASVASFFVSRIDTAVDAAIDSRLKTELSTGDRERLTRVRGQVAIANARLAYQHSRVLFAGPRWEALRAAGAMPQRVLWASTGTKDPAYRDVVYVEELIGPDTVNTVPPATYKAFLDHGRVRSSITDSPVAARAVLDDLLVGGVSLRAITDRLLDEGLASFEQAFGHLLRVVGAGRQTSNLSSALRDAVNGALGRWAADRGSERLWARDASLWTGGNEAAWLGWLDVVGAQVRSVAELESFAADARAFEHVVLMGMGGSSLAPEVLSLCCPARPGSPAFHVLDSTDPARIRRLEAAIDPKRTLFVVASKSGSTLEPALFCDYFLARLRELVGVAAGAQFVAITDPGSKLEMQARAAGFRAVYPGLASIGGRYSALSAFGLVPAAAAGLDVRQLLARAQTMVRACGAAVRAEDNPGVVLGLTLAAAAKSGRDKLTLVMSPTLAPLGAWLEQLIAESTGKRGMAIVPVDGEPVGPPARYGADRVFVYTRLADDPHDDTGAALAALIDAGHPVVRIDVDSVTDLGQEFFRWEIATAVAGAALGIDPFDQPDVEASKIATRELTERHAASGTIPSDPPVYQDRELAIHVDPAAAAVLRRTAGAGESAADWLRAHLGRVAPGDYVGILAYLDATGATDVRLRALREYVRDRTRAATCLGYGPRFLHSTGQAYKGGPNTGVFLQITTDDAHDLAIPGRPYTFGFVKAAQALGDLNVLVDRGRRAMRVHLRGDQATALAALAAAVHAALK